MAFVELANGVAEQARLGSGVLRIVGSLIKRIKAIEDSIHACNGDHGFAAGDTTTTEEARAIDVKAEDKIKVDNTEHEDKGAAMNNAETRPIDEDFKQFIREIVLNVANSIKAYKKAKNMEL